MDDLQKRLNAQREKDACPNCKHPHGASDGPPPEGCLRALKGTIHEYVDTFGLLHDAVAKNDIEEVRNILERRVPYLKP